MEAEVTNLPSRLIKVPLIDAIFEIRFPKKPLASNLLLSSFISKYGNKIELQEAAIQRNFDPVNPNTHEFKFDQMITTKVDGFRLAFGDSAIVVVCEPPYKGWPAFREQIVSAYELLVASQVATRIERCAIRCMNIIDKKWVDDPAGAFNLNLAINNVGLTSAVYGLRFEQPADITGILNVVSMSGEASASINGESRSGPYIDIDTICLSIHDDVLSRADIFLELLDNLRAANKGKFFECISTKTLQQLGVD